VVTWRPAALLAAGALTIPFVPMPWIWLLGIAALVAAATAVDFFMAVDPAKAVTLTRSGATVVRLGEPTTVELAVTNQAGRALVGELRDAWPPSAGATEDRSRLRLSPGETVILPTRLQPVRRGDRTPDVVSIRSYGPMRFAFRQPSRRVARVLSPAWTVRVLPRFESARLVGEKVSRLRAVDGSIATRGRGQGSEFDSLREYVFGDDVRSIDWRATARRRDVVVRTWRPERDRRVVMVLDTGRTSAVRVGTAPRLDAAMDAAQLLATVASRAGDRIDLLAVDTAVRADVTGTTRHTLLARLAHAMAPLAPALAETDFRLVVSEVLRRERKRALVIIYTSLEPGVLAEGLLPALPQIAGRHKVVIASVHDDELGALMARRTSVADIYAAAAAERTLAERERIASALGAFGVEVIDAPVSTFASQVADAYLRLKASGQL
jgi:uncharacterized protein (DUF58 family)